jgi:hypothetical protein
MIVFGMQKDVSIRNPEKFGDCRSGEAGRDEERSVS